MNFYDVAFKIDKLIRKEVASEEIRDLLAIIKSDDAYQQYLFRNVSDIYWFFTLKEEGYFAPINNPPPAHADQEGYYAIPEWNILPYLERISHQVSKPENEKYIDDLLAI